MSRGTNELTHYGVKGMKWGVRRYRNKDGSLTPAGEAKRAKSSTRGAKKTRGSVRDRLKKGLNNEAYAEIGKTVAASGAGFAAYRIAGNVLAKSGPTYLSAPLFNTLARVGAYAVAYDTVYDTADVIYKALQDKSKS